MSDLRYIDDVVTLTYDETRCTGCQFCTWVCPHGVFVMDGNRARMVDRDACIECGACERNCAFDAIHVRAGVGCAAAIISSWFAGRKEPSCGGPADTGSPAGGNCC